MFEKGLGVTQDLVIAAKLYQKSADLGNPLAQFLLGTLFYSHSHSLPPSLHPSLPPSLPRSRSLAPSLPPPPSYVPFKVKCITRAKELLKISRLLPSGSIAALRQAMLMLKSP